jgi:hypothetical protein
MSKIKAGIRRGMADAYYRTGQFRRRLRGKVVILAYHRSSPEGIWPGPTSRLACMSTPMSSTLRCDS